MQKKNLNSAPKYRKFAPLLSLFLGVMLLITIPVGSILGQSEEPELEWIGGYDASASTEVKGLALIQKGGDWIRVYKGDTHTMSSAGHVNRYIGNNAGLDAEHERVTNEETPSLVWEYSEFLEEGATVEGLAIIEFDDEWLRVYEGDTHTMNRDGHVNYYTGNDAGLDTEYDRLITEQSPALEWTHSEDVEANTTIEGLALIQKGDSWIKVYEGDTYTTSSKAHVNYYVGNNFGLNIEYNRVLEEEQIPTEEIAELEWEGWHTGEPGTVVEGLALIEKDTGWIRVYSGYTYTMTTTGNVHTYTGNNTGLDAEYDRLTQ